VALAAIEDLTKGRVGDSFPVATVTYGDTIADQIVAAVSRGFNQGFITFAAVARRWGYHEPERFMEVFRRIPPRQPSDPIPEDERASWGEILINAWRHVSSEERPTVANLAAAFLGSLERKNSFTERQRAYALVLAGRLEDARPIFSALLANNPDAWVLYRYSQFLLEDGQPAEALDVIDTALGKLPDGPKYRAAFLHHRCLVRHALRDPSAVDDLRAAIPLADSDR
jgi:tetratricopeptide (TPR) repeat protein